MNDPAWEHARNILCIRLDALGDVLMTTPAIRALKDGAPGRHITLLTSPSGAVAAPYLPMVDDVIVYESPWMKACAQRASAAPELAMAARLGELRFDAAVLFTVYSQSPLPSALLCHLAGIPLRLAHCRENPYQLLTHWQPELEPERLARHEVQRQLDLVAAIGCQTPDPRLAFAVPPEAHRHIQTLLGAEHFDEGAPWVVIHPGATAPSRRYPPACFAAAADALAQAHGWRIVLTGGPDEEAMVASVAAHMQAPAVNFAGRLSLAEMGALLAAAPLLIANNTGPIHLAAAVGTPVVDLYALTNPQHTPWAVPHLVLNHDVPCKYCYKSICPAGHHDCLRLVEPDAVVAAALALTGCQRARPRPVAAYGLADASSSLGESSCTL